jgi:ABC-type Fe3+-hydroxamate transport system substrate-binding protein
MLLLAAGLYAALASAPKAAAGERCWPVDLHERAAAPFPRAVDEVAIAAAPQRVVAASVFSAETLLEVVPTARLCGVHFLAAEPRYSRVAQAARSLTLLGASPEQWITARPDLVVIDEFTLADTAILLGSLGVPAVRTRAVTCFADVADNIRLLGFATGADEAAEELCRRLDARRAEIARKKSGLEAWRVMNLNGALDTYGASSLLDDCVRLAGARHLPAEHGVGGYRKLDVESVLSWRPDALIVSCEEGEAEGAAWVEQHPGLCLLPCVQQGRIVRIPGSLLSSTSHHAVEVAALLQQQLRDWGRP